MRLSLREVRLRFGGVQALDSVSFDVEPGSVHAVIGPNGAGKSSCFNAISGLYAVTGSIRLGDLELTGLPPHVIAGLIGTDVGEGQAGALEDAVVFAAEEAGDGPAGPDLEPPKLAADVGGEHDQPGSLLSGSGSGWYCSGGPPG